MKGKKYKFDPIEKIGPFDLVPRATLERLYRKSGMSYDQAKEAVQSLIDRGEITVTKYTGLFKDTPLYKKI